MQMNQKSQPQKYSPEEFRMLIDNILDKLYPEFYNYCDKIRRRIELSSESFAAESLLNRINEVQEEAERISYKERLILFPFLEKEWNKEEAAPDIPGIDKIVEETREIKNKLKKMGSKLKEIQTGEDSVEMSELLTGINQAWEGLSLQKKMLWDVFIHYKQ